MTFIKDWFLVIGILLGAGLYLFYHSLESLHYLGPELESICVTIQPALLFVMLFLSFCKIEPRELRPHRWHFWALLIQGGSFVGGAMMITWATGAPGAFSSLVLDNRLSIEAFMLCMICPTATACTVMTYKLGGNMAQVVSYTTIINLLVSILVPLTIPIIYQNGDITFATASLKILRKVFPLLIMPCLVAWMIRSFLPKLHAWLQKQINWSFYIWGVALTLAILMSTRAIVHFRGSIWVLLGIALASLMSCALQFWVGRKIGSRLGSPITASQAMGQKNTVFAIWMGYTFMEPIVSVAGGFYSIWHNVWNSYQLYRKRQEDRMSKS